MPVMFGPRSTRTINPMLTIMSRGLSKPTTSSFGPDLLGVQWYRAAPPRSLEAPSKIWCQSQIPLSSSCISSWFTSFKAVRQMLARKIARCVRKVYSGFMIKQIFTETLHPLHEDAIYFYLMIPLSTGLLLKRRNSHKVIMAYKSLYRTHGSSNLPRSYARPLYSRIS